MTRPTSTPTMLERAIDRRDWEAAALYAVLIFTRALRDAPEATLDDVLAVLTPVEERDDTRGR